MKKYMKMILLGFGLCMMLPATVTNAADHSATVTFLARYDDSIPAQNGDYFQMTVKNLKNNKTQEISLDASDALGEGVHTSLALGEYRVIEFDYQGYNPDIEKSGYGITSLFSVNQDYTGIEIAVGTTEAQRLQAEYTEVLMRQDEEYINDLVSEEISNETQGIEEEDVSETSDYTDNIVDELKQGTVIDEEKLAEIEQNMENERESAEEDAERSEINYYVAMLPIAVVALAGFVIIYVLHRKKIL